MISQFGRCESSLGAASEGDAPAAAPVIVAPSTLSVAQDARLRYLVQATGNPAPSIHLISGPAGLTVHKGALIWSVPSGERLGNYRVTVVAKNALGKKHATFSISVNTDVTPPTAPFLSLGAVITTNAVPLTWTASTDNVGIADNQATSNIVTGITLIS